MISIATWVLWLHLLAMATWVGGAAIQLLAILPGTGAGGETAGVARRAHFVTSRGMEIVIITGVLNVLLRGLASHGMFSLGFIAMLSVKLLLVIAMVGLQVWLGTVWKREEGPQFRPVRRARIAITIQLILGAAAVLLGLGVRSM
jgi:hypothetical protein